MKRLIAILLIFAMVIPCAIYSAADETVLDCFEVTCDTAMTVDKYTIGNLTDGDAQTSTMFTPVKGTKIEFLAKVPVNISGVKIAVENFPGWRNIKEITVTYDLSDKRVISVEDFVDDVRWVEDTISKKNISSITIEITDVYENNDSTHGALAEVAFYGTALEEYESNDILVADTNRTLNYMSDFTYVTTSSKISAVDNWFDNNFETHAMMSKLKDNYVVFQFKYPTDLTSISLTSVDNSDWAMIKALELGYYNTDHKYRTRLKYPGPAYSETVYPVEKTSARQTIDLADDSAMKQITHLVMKFNDVYMTSTGADWGGVFEFEFSGIPNTKATPVAETLGTELVSNASIIKEWGLLGDNEVNLNKQPTRMEGADMILRLLGEYDTAKSYVGTYNFSDAKDQPCALNRMSYIYAYKKFGIEGDLNGRFKPKANLQAKEFYKMILCMMGYEYGADFTWDNMHQFLRGMGEKGVMGDMLYTSPFTVKDMCNVLWEALNTIPKGSDVILAEKLYNEGKMPDTVWNKFADKFDKQVVEVSRKEYVPADTVNKSGDFTFMQVDDPQQVTDWHFMYNACYHYSGVYHGTLPKDDPRNQRENFAKALETIGAKTLRWPGGNTVHWYFMEEGSQKHVDKLFEDATAFNGVRPGGFYDPQDPDDAYYVEFYDFLDFCKEYNIDTLLQVNPIYYIDEGDETDPNDDRVRSVLISNLNSKKDANGNQYTIPGYFDRLRIEEGAEDLRKNLKEMKQRGYECYMWEIGNEDHWKDYSGENYANNPYVKDMFRMYVAYAKVIKEEFPGSKVCIDTFNVPDAISAGIITTEEAKLFDAITDHYPFARWSAPTGETEKRNAWQFAANNDHMIEQAWINRQSLDWGVGERMITESTAYRFQNWSSTSVEHTFAHALVVAHNWGEAVFDCGWTLACLHDLESQWLGFIQHNSTFNTGYRYFNRMYEGHPNVHEDDIPDNYKFFDEKFYTNSAGRAFELLGRHSGGAALETLESNMNRFVSGYSTVNGDKVTITLVNSLNETRPVTIKFSNLSVPVQTVKATELRTEDIFAVMPEDYIMTDNTEVVIKGNAENFAENAIEMEVKPFSITHFTFKINN